MPNLAMMETQNNKYINFPKLHKNTHLFIKSNLGTGKTQGVKKLIANYDTVLYISARKTFTHAIKQELGNFKSYLDIKEQLIKNTPKLIIQIDSINRVYDINSYQLVIFDEIESVLTHMT